ncbi:MAG TPA: sugar phosphate isomerase/epimerase [bacterium]|jgi:2-keto-myo-inositol isomerase|nr:sugar phosphate isomerase/epimerase [bacterium]
MRRYGLNGATTGTADLLTDLAVAQEAGFDALEIRDAKLEGYLAQGGSLTDLVGAFAEARLLPLSLNALERATPSPRMAREGVLDRCRTLCRWALELGCPYVVAVPGPAEGLDDDEISHTSVEALRAMGEIGRDHAVGIGFEFLGSAASSVRTVAAAREIVEAVADPAVGLVIDAFHYYVGGSTPEMLRGMDPRRLFIVHLDDAEDRPREALTDAHRLLPGEGVIPLHELVQTLEGIGYEGVYSVELFRPEYWAWDPLDLARAARESLDALFAGLGEK